MKVNILLLKRKFLVLNMCIWHVHLFFPAVQPTAPRTKGPSFDEICNYCRQCGNWSEIALFEQRDKKIKSLGLIGPFCHIKVLILRHNIIPPSRLKLLLIQSIIDERKQQMLLISPVRCVLLLLPTVGWFSCNLLQECIIHHGSLTIGFMSHDLR